MNSCYTKTPRSRMHKIILVNGHEPSCRFFNQTPNHYKGLVSHSIFHLYMPRSLPLVDGVDKARANIGMLYKSCHTSFSSIWYFPIRLWMMRYTRRNSTRIRPISCWIPMIRVRMALACISWSARIAAAFGPSVGAKIDLRTRRYSVLAKIALAQWKLWDGHRHMRVLMRCRIKLTSKAKLVCRRFYSAWVTVMSRGRASWW